LIHFYKRVFRVLLLMMALQAGVQCQQRLRPFVDVLQSLKGCCATTFSTKAANRSDDSEPAYYRAATNDTRQHTLAHRGTFFTVDPKIIDAFGDELNTVKNKYAINYFAPRPWTQRNKVLGETNILIRKPALELINYIKSSDLSKPAVRYVLYGRDGVGKSITLAHLICYGYQDNYIVMPFAWIKKWLVKYYEVKPSTYSPGRIDHVANANIFLKNFKHANADRLTNCVTHKEYKWGSKDRTKVGAPLMEVINIGCERLTYAADALNVVIKELKMNCNDSNCKLMVVCDGVNCLFADHTLVNKENPMWKPRKYVDWQDWRSEVALVDECSVMRNIKKLLLNDYNNAVIITSVDIGAQMIKTDPGNKWWISMERHMVPDATSPMPFSLLGDKGWSVLNPFIPIEVEKYTEQEMDTTIDLTVDSRWVRPEMKNSMQRSEIHFLTGRNPKDFFNFSTLY